MARKSARKEGKDEKKGDSDSGSNLSIRVSFSREVGDTFFEVISRQNSRRDNRARAHRARWDGAKISSRNIGFESYVREMWDERAHPRVLSEGAPEYNATGGGGGGGDVANDPRDLHVRDLFAPVQDEYFINPLGYKPAIYVGRIIRDKKRPSILSSIF